MKPKRCPACGQWIDVKPDGTLRRHDYWRGGRYGPCSAGNIWATPERPK